jgi:Uma2 family endonuclease
LISPESEHRDRTVKLRKYAEAGIKHYWLIDEENDRTVAHVYELDEPTRSSAPTGIVRGKLELAVPFSITIDLDGLFPTTR